MAGLACGLALLTSHTLWHWRTEEAVWQHATIATPTHARAWVNLAVLRMRAGDADGAADYLARAEQIAAHEDPFQQAWSHDVIDANRAVLAAQRGAWHTAAALVAHAPIGTTRREVCEVYQLCEAQP